VITVYIKINRIFLKSESFISINRNMVTAKVITDYLTYLYTFDVGGDSSVGVVTSYGLDGPGIESRWWRDFPHLSRPALGPTQHPVQWVLGFPGIKSGRSVTLTPHLLLVPLVMK
jgi:hypothetical protein